MVMTMVLAGAFSALSQGMQMSSQARGEQFADRILTSEVSFLQTLNWSSFSQVNKVVDGSGALLLEERHYTNAETMDLLANRGYFAGDIPLRNMRLKVDSINQFPGTSYERKLLTLTLSWNDIDGRNMSREVEFIFSKDGIYDSNVPRI